MGFLNNIFGSKVKVPKFQEIDPDAEIEKAFKSIQDQLPEAQRTTKSLAKADAETTLDVLEQFAPGSREAIKQQVQTLQSGLRGELPADVQRAIQDQSAARAFAGGFGGSGAARNLELRDLGLTSLQRIDTAMNQSAQTFGTLRGLMPQQRSVSSMFLMPGQRIGLAQQERNMRYNRDLQAAQAKAQPDPVWEAAGGLIGTAAGAVTGGLLGSTTLGSKFLGLGNKKAGFSEGANRMWNFMGRTSTYDPTTDLLA